MKIIDLSFLFTFLFFFCVSQSAHPCTPCKETLGLQATINNSDLVLIGRLADPHSQDIYSIEVIEVLKGKNKKNYVQVFNDYGMCGKAYGLDLDDKTYVIFLQKKGELFETVQSGCAVRKLPVNDGVISIRLSDFKKEHGL
ncbi:hypothetical protein BVX98_00390 [bacterium F11]|nr:hypothetical protein BVX98_00390 [bacterium F11]